MSRQTRSRSKEKTTLNVSGGSLRSSPHGVGDNTGLRRSPRGVSDNTSYRSQASTASDEEEEDYLDESHDSVDHARVTSYTSHYSFNQSEDSLSFADGAVGSPFEARYGKEKRGSDSLFEHSSGSTGLHVSPASRGRQGTSPRKATGELYPDLSPFKQDGDDAGLTRRKLHPSSPQTKPSRQQTSPRIKTIPTTSHPPQDENKNFLNDYANICLICLLILLILVFLFISPFFKSGDEPKLNLKAKQSQREKLLARFEQEFRPMLSMFPSQSASMLKTLKAASKSVLREANPLKPGIIMLAGNKDAFETIDCIAKHMMKISAQTYGQEYGPQHPIEITPEKLTNFKDYQTVKKYLDETLNTGFSEIETESREFHGKTKVALIHNIEKIHGKAAMLFHAFCDNENAPYKDTVIIFTVHMATEKQITDEEEVEAYLDRVWTPHIDIDSRSPLMTRIANFVAIVTPESAETLRQHC